MYKTALPSSAANSLAKLLANWIDRRVAPGGLNPAVRTVVVCVVGALLVGVWQWVGASSWLMVVAAFLTVVAVVWLGRPKPTVATPETAVALPGFQRLRRRRPDHRREHPPTPPCLSRRTRFLLAAGCVVAAGTIIGVAWFRRVQQRPPTTPVRDYLTFRFALLPVRVATLDVTNVQPGAAGSRLVYHAVLETTESQFRRLPTVDYLRAHAASELASIDAANALLNGPNGARLRTALGAASPTPDVRESVLLTTETPPGSMVALTATLFAWRRDGAWVFTGDRTGFERPPFAGDPKPARTRRFRGRSRSISRSIRAGSRRSWRTASRTRRRSKLRPRRSPPTSTASVGNRPKSTPSSSAPAPCSRVPWRTARGAKATALSSSSRHAL